MSEIPPGSVPAHPAAPFHDAHEPDRTRWFGLLLPYFALALLIASIVLLVWLVRQYDADEQQTTLISDVLWMEQSLRFQLDRNESILRQLGPDLLGAARLPAQAEAQLKQLMSQDRSLVRVFWLGPDGTPLGAFPPQPRSGAGGEDSLTATSASVATLAHAVGRAVYGPAYQAAGAHHQFEVHTPAWSGEAFLGTVAGVYSLSDLISRELPWWFSERYRVEVLDPDGREIAAKTKIAPLEAHRSYTTPFDPPGHGLMLRITAYRGETRWMPLLLIASIVLFGAVIVWSIWQLRLQLARRQAAEAALLRETAFRNAMENSVITGLRARDRQGRLTHVNPAFCRMVGYSAEELIGRPPPMPYWDPEYIERTQEMHDIIMNGGTPREGVELRLRRKDGTRLDALVFEAPLIDSQGRHSGWMGSVLDITEQKRAEELARQQEERLQATSRLITMGEMASTLAHELNQPLAAISSYNSGCIYRLDAGGEIDRAELRDIHARLGRQAQRAGEIIRRVHDFVRRSEPKRVPVDINATIRDALELFEGDTRKRRMRVLTQLADRLPEIDADPVMIEQILVNLVRNAMDAMRDNPPGRRSVRITTGLEDDLLVVRVADLGHGIPPEAARRLFEPFFTTKQEGMGMGLNICRSIAELHRGRLGFEANPEGGTIFILSLPVQPA
ncbi:PAS domain S-box protein [Pseudothauera nasutitermitis]|uniref:histidine kinase n=1 Tax=Pseudothauera nasutitermitis TaxID=2565930 RepID=A0A4S4AQ87_9RHOO|nr:PAS domain S-box protein [Pseudothauera nasutitermitis]THF61833.1 PAS domain S-box protein [Pseudothauera nasutitermitis]